MRQLVERYSLRDARDHLQQLVYDAQHGKTVMILDENEQAVQLVPVTAEQKPRKAGSARGLVKMAADFDQYME
jgi:antitoxin (DNA-binding transcriptional repressor) of toxin-antitoxin stability system